MGGKLKNISSDICKEIFYGFVKQITDVVYVKYGVQFNIVFIYGENECEAINHLRNYKGIPLGIRREVRACIFWNEMNRKKTDDFDIVIDTTDWQIR